MRSALPSPRCHAQLASLLRYFNPPPACWLHGLSPDAAAAVPGLVTATEGVVDRTGFHDGMRGITA
jgi:hypothetical protein